MTEDDTQQRHKRAMQKRKEVVDEKIAAATEERGIFVLITGNGKGKSTSGFGTVLRCLGHGYRAGIVQFIKGGWECGERNFLEGLDGLEYHVMGTGFTWETQDKEKDRRAAREVWPRVVAMMQDPAIRVLLLDEITYMLKYGHIDIDEVADALAARPRDQTVIMTGRSPHKRLYELADTVSEVTDVKHAFRAGVKAQKGVDF